MASMSTQPSPTALVKRGLTCCHHWPMTVSDADDFLRVRLNDGTGNFGTTTFYWMVAGAEPKWIACSNLDGDEYAPGFA